MAWFLFVVSALENVVSEMTMLSGSAAKGPRQGAC
jgi:hypothetical protein